MASEVGSTVEVAGPSHSQETIPTNSTKAQRFYRFIDSIKSAIFIVGTGAIVFVAFSNSITWHMQSFWGASADFWERHWAEVHDFFNGNDVALGVLLPGLVTYGGYWLFNIFFLIADWFHWPKWMHKYKIQEDVQVPQSKILRCMVVILLTQIFVSTPVGYLVWQVMKARGCTYGYTLPSFQTVLFELFVFIWVEEFGFYYGHRLMHHPKLYKHFHKMHHEWTSPIGLAGLYAHPVETIVVNSLPMMAGPLICGSHMATAMLWFLIGVFSSTISHCGYHLPFLPSPEAHDFHHLKFTNNFGMLGVLDRLHGTDAMFRASKQGERHVLLLSLVPIKDMFPEDKKKGM